MTTTPTSGAADLPDAMHMAELLENPINVVCQKTAAAVLRHQHSEFARLHALAAGQATAAQAVVQDDLITLRKPTTSAELLWLLKLAHLVISDVGKTLEETFAPAQPAAEASRFGSPELQAMIIARCVEKDQADSVPAVSDLPPLPAPDLRDVGTKPQEIKEFLKGYATEYARAAIAARAPADSVQEDAARLDFLIDQRAYVVSDPDACPGHWLRWARPDGSTWVQVDEHPTPRAAIDAARKQGARWQSAVRALTLHI